MPACLFDLILTKYLLQAANCAANENVQYRTARVVIDHERPGRRRSPQTLFFQVNACPGKCCVAQRHDRFLFDRRSKLPERKIHLLIEQVLRVESAKTRQVNILADLSGVS